ncbi:Metallo-dependent hydrolase [Neurospora crassa]|uniref:Adenosine deaminase n=2 Tax=Neurospora crassa TaxID=5141 RepID=Q7RXS1_NEUCR|nr:adenosine deaminase [Neurospora crassa OR74A]EAA27466.3 adenosine deaminase [Neurospora crassa OR74A]KHE87916.1 Metallo-dependent hydrolase [Neurospora crassa]|eukprot:XP_956702.3 adenosine deaminase [Neurospora crassa OR74A]
MTVDAVDHKALPKIELHAHLSGSISRQCLHEVWLKKKENGETDLQDPLIEMPLGKHDYDLKTFFPLFSSYIYHLVSDVWALRYTTLSVLSDFASDGVVYLELRTTPRAMPHAGLTKAQYVSTILSAIAEFESTTTSALKTKLILSVDRRNTLPEAYEVLALCRQFSGQGGVVGIDLCGDPAKGPIDIFTPVFEEARRTIPGLGITLHFAEAEASGTEEELLTLLSWKPDRIGHVIHLNKRIREKVKRRGGMGLELCLSCNVHAGMVCGGVESHHFGEWWKVEETVVVLSTDDVGVFGSPLSNEYALVAKHFGLTRADICSLVRRGIDVIFGGDEEKERLRALMWSA